ncbi:MAG TPA: M20/M25/M40 family metallo-hydrolase [Candidatus Angelobacter sp.]|nr:M20/M25/M40 family metallo-hydrolase [Candidatus Angelobacter sp.]
MHKAMVTVPAKPASGLGLSLLAWVFLISVATLAIWELKPPEPLPATAPPEKFSAARALNHVSVIARVPHPIDSAANVVVKTYLLAQMTALGLNPQVLDANGVAVGPGQTIIARTHDVVGRMTGTSNSKALLLMAHYDSVSSAPGAADDAAGVAAILEAVRALRMQPLLKNDLIVLFTDGEEGGLLGADAFATSHPWVKDVGVILNFEARGNQGPSLLFETTPNNRTLIKIVGQSAPFPVGSSLFYSLYKLLPNDTDVTVFRSYGIPALNFAFGGDLDAYHSGLDSVDNLSAASLQHHGSYALALARSFGNMDLNELKNQKQDDIFFDVLGSSFVSYPETWVIPGEVLVSLLLAGAILLQVRQLKARAGRIFLGLLLAIGVVITIMAVLGAAEWLVALWLHNRMLLGDSTANSLLLLGELFLGASAGTMLFAGFREHFTASEMSLAGIVLVAALSWALAVFLPAGSYLLFWPLFFGTLALFLQALIKSGAGAWPGNFFGFGGAAVTVLLVAPIIYLLYLFLTLQLITALAIGLLMGIFFVACVRFVDMAIPRTKRPGVVLVLIVCGLTCIMIGAKLSAYSPQHPRHDSIVYSLNADDHTAFWISYDAVPDQWTSQFFANQKGLRQSMPNYLYGSTQHVLSTQTTALELIPPVLEIKSNQQEGDLRRIRFSVKSQRNASTLLLRFGNNVEVMSLALAGRPIAFRHPSNNLIVLIGTEIQAEDLDLTIKGPSRIQLRVTDRSFGLPLPYQPRSNRFVATQRSDYTLVGKEFWL